jgi:hypothetical protein
MGHYKTIKSVVIWSFENVYYLTQMQGHGEGLGEKYGGRNSKANLN